LKIFSVKSKFHSKVAKTQKGKGKMRGKYAEFYTTTQMLKMWFPYLLLEIETQIKERDCLRNLKVASKKKEREREKKQDIYNTND
jgi:hypothetical protein